MTTLLVLDEVQLKEAFNLYCLHTFLCASNVLTDWIGFQYKASTTGVTQFEYDQMTLSEEAFDEKYYGDK